MTQNSNGNDKFKDWREVKIIENCVCKNLVSHIWSGAFLVNFGHISHEVPLFIFLFWTSKYRLGRLSKMEDLCDFQINLFPSYFHTFSIQSGVFFYIPIYRGYYPLPCHDFKANIQEEKTFFKMATNMTRSNILNGK